VRPRPRSSTASTTTPVGEHRRFGDLVWDLVMFPPIWLGIW
jgi:hypothetical protein